MEIIKSISEAKGILGLKKNLILIPTMGNLHKGHLSLIEEGKGKGSIVVSIFVNPLQFGPKEDFKQYPRTIESDLNKLEDINCEFVFMPGNNFVDDIKKTIAPPLAKRLCGKNRPGHFDGVLSIINKIFDTIKPQVSFFGLKDYQQYILIKDFAKNYYPNMEIIGCPIIREDDGLAMSSRNNLLSIEERKLAPYLYRRLKWIQDNKDNYPISDLVKRSLNFLESKKFNVDYLNVYDLESLNDKNKFDKGALIAVAAKLGSVRLIDNIICRN